MATKAMKKTQKKKGSYDNKLIMWISIGLAVFVALIIGVYFIITATTGFIGKVDGYKIYDYEYQYYLELALSEEYSDNYEKPENADDMSDEELAKHEKDFWTEERKAKCADKALDEARKFKAMYSLSIKNGYKLNSTERANLKSQIDTYYSMYLNYGYSSEMILNYFFFGMSLPEYKEYAIQQAAIEKYKEVLKEKYNATEEDLREIYDEDPDYYRLVSIRYLQVNKPTKPSVPKDSSGKEIAADTTNADDKAKYDDYLKDLEKYNKELEEAKKFAEAVMEAYNAGLTYKVKDDKGKETEYKTFADLVKGESDDKNSSTNSGLYEVNSNSSLLQELVDFALTMQWNEDRTQIIKVEKEDDKEEDKEEDKEDTESSKEESTPAPQSDDENKEEDNKEDKKDPMTALEIIETDGAFYVVRAEDIEDFDNSVESKEGAKDSIKDKIEVEWLEDEAVKELEQMVENAGSKFKVNGKKQDKIDEMLKAAF